MQARIEHFTQRNLTAKAVVAGVSHFNRMHREELPDDPPHLPEEALARLAARPPQQRLHVWLVWRGAGVAARASLSWLELETNRRLAHVYVSVEPALRGRGIGSRLFSLAVAEAARVRRPLLGTVTSDRVPAGARFAARHGFRRGLATHLNQLTIARLDRSLMARWIETSVERARDYAIELWEGPVPTTEIGAFAKLVEVMNTVPHGDLEIEHFRVTPELIRNEERWLFANGTRRLLAVARVRKDGALVGFTSLSWSPKRAAIVAQGDTGVVPDHRNRGLGRWLKAFNIEALLRANAEARFVRTGNADSNAPMLAINRQMGFEPLVADMIWQGRAPVIACRLALAGHPLPAPRETEARFLPWRTA